MKQLVLFVPLCLAMTLSFGSCSSDVEQKPEISQPEAKSPKSEYLRSTSDAKECVREFLTENSSLRGLNPADRVIENVLDLKNDSQLRSNDVLSEFADNCYVVTFKSEKGYAIVSKDKRSFPILAVLDSGAYKSSNLSKPEFFQHVQNMLDGSKKEVEDYQEALKSLSSQEELRGNKDYPSLNTETAKEDMLNEGWRLTRSAGPRLNTTWGQDIKRKGFYIDSRGISYDKAYSPENQAYHQNNNLRSSAFSTDAFGCTPIAFGQVMYALRKFPGFNTLKYSNGEKVLWENMRPYSAKFIESQRFLGWFTANCDPIYFKSGTMIFNITATKFLRGLVGDNIVSRYDNCIVGDGDFDGYGWAEDRRVSEDFFKHPHAFMIMTASSGAFNYVSYHTFVIDGMIEFKKRIKGSGFLGTGLFSRWRDGVRHLYHINAGWDGHSNGYYLYVQNVNDEFKYTGTNDALDYRSKPAYLILWPTQEN